MDVRLGRLRGRWEGDPNSITPCPHNIRRQASPQPNMKAFVPRPDPLTATRGPKPEPSRMPRRALGRARLAFGELPIESPLEARDETLGAEGTPGSLVRAQQLARRRLQAFAQVGAPIGDQCQHRRRRHQLVVPAGEVSLGARPRPARGPLHQPGPRRIELDIADGCQKMRFVQGKGGEPALPEIAAPVLAKIDPCLSGYHPHPLYVVCLLGLQARAGAGALRRRSG